MTEQSIDHAVLRDVLGHYPTGVVLVTGVHPDGELLAMIVGTFTSVSLDPPLVAFLPMRTSRTFARLQECQSLCINVLAGEQEDLCRRIASRHSDKFDGIQWHPSPSGDPILDGSLAWLDVRLTDTIDAGDHWIAMCKVMDLAVTNPVAPLIFFQGGYGTFIMPSLVARMDDDIIHAVRSAAACRGDLQTLATRIGCEVSLLVGVNRDELAAIATAVGAGVNASEGLGERVPMVPPIGDTYMCHADEETQQHWLAKAHGADDDTLQVFRERLEFCRQHGYLMSFLPPDHGQSAYAEMHHAAHLYASGHITPAQERDVRQRILNSRVDYSLRPIEADQSYDIGSIVLPFQDRQRHQSFTLRLAQLPHSASGETVRDWISQAQQTVATVETRLSNPQ